MVWSWVAVAMAAPFQMLQPAHTMPSGETEMGGAVAYLASPRRLPFSDEGIFRRYVALDPR